MFDPHSGDAAFVPIADPFAFQVLDRLYPRRRDQGGRKPVTPAADDAQFVVAKSALGKRCSHMDVGNNVDVEGDHVAHDGTDLVITLAIGPASVLNRGGSLNA